MPTTPNTKTLPKEASHEEIAEELLKLATSTGYDRLVGITSGHSTFLCRIQADKVLLSMQTNAPGNFVEDVSIPKNLADPKLVTKMVIFMRCNDKHKRTRKKSEHKL